VGTLVSKGPRNVEPSSLPVDNCERSSSLIDLVSVPFTLESRERLFSSLLCDRPAAQRLLQAPQVSKRQGLDICFTAAPSRDDGVQNKAARSLQIATNKIGRREL